MSTVQSAAALLERVQYQINAQRVGLHDFFELHRNRLDDVRQEVLAARSSCSGDYDVLAQQRRELEQRRARLTEDQQSLDELWARTRQQRQTIAQQLSAQRRALRAEQQKIRDRLNLAQRRVAEARYGEHTGDAAEAELLDYAVSLEAQLAQAQRDVERLNRALAQREEELRQASQQAAAEQPHDEQLMSEAWVADVLAVADERAQAAPHETTSCDTSFHESSLHDSASIEAAELAALREELQALQEELQEALRRNTELEAELKEAARRQSHRAAAQGEQLSDGLDWEAQKRRILAALEADEGESTISRADRLTVEGTIEITDEIVAEKDREIADLRRQLELARATRQPDHSEALNSDEAVQEERQRLRELQVEWEEKMRVSEIEISVQRAKIARERAELEEKRTSIEQEAHRGTRVTADTAIDSADPKAAKGNWLARLGLKKEDE